MQSYVKCFQASLKDKTFPERWKTSTIIPRHKSGDKTSIINYRPIHHTCFLSRIMERVVNTKLLTHLSTSTLHPSQHGFLSNKSCITCQTSFLELATSSIDAKKCTIIIYFDMRKAFDRVPHKRLLLKLARAGIIDPLHSWLASFLSHRSQFVSIGNCNAPNVAITSGVIQGSVLGPALFLAYINDIVSCFSHGIPFLFADDCKVIYSFDSAKFLETIQLIRDDLLRLESWCHDWCMNFNTEKCYILSNRCTIPPNSIFIHGTALREVHSVRDLGLHYTLTLNFTEHIQRQAVSATRLSFLISRHFLTPSAKLHLYKTSIRPILDYGCFALSLALKRDLCSLESIQRNFTRLICPDNSLTYRERCISLQIDPLWLRRMKLNLTHIYKLFQSPGGLLQQFRAYFRSPTRALRNSECLLYPPRARCKTRANFLLIRYSPIWNALPNALRNDTSIAHFKRELYVYLTVERAALLLNIQVQLDKLYTDGISGI